MILNTHYVMIFPEEGLKHKTEITMTFSADTKLYFNLIGATLTIDNTDVITTPSTRAELTSSTYKNYPSASYVFTTGTHTIGIDDTVEGTDFTSSAGVMSSDGTYQQLFSGFMSSMKHTYGSNGNGCFFWKYLETVTSMVLKGYVPAQMFYTVKHDISGMGNLYSNWEMCATVIDKFIPGDQCFMYFNGPISSCKFDDSVTTIPSLCFYGSTGLQTVSIPASVTTIEHAAFWECTSLTTVTVMATTPPTLQNNTVLHGNTSLMRIYVPYSADHSILNAYKSATNWTELANLMEEIQ